MKRAPGLRTDSFLVELVHGESGQDVVEYALIAVFLGLGAVASLSGLAAKVISVFGAVGSTITGAA